MAIQIELTPEIPESLKIAALQKNLVPFVGAGISMLAGGPDWNRFADSALRTFVPDKLSYAELDQILSLTARIKLSIARDLQDKHKQPIDFSKLLSPSESKKDKGERVYDCIQRLGNIIVTTNYDSWLDEPRRSLSITNEDQDESSEKPDISPRIFYDKKDLTVENLEDQNSVFHIHGSTRDPETMILTAIDYLNLYANHSINGANIEENPYLTFLRHLFKIKNVLFMGYGLSELEILEYIFQKGLESPGGKKENPRHYVLQGFYSHQMDLATQMEAYFKHFGIGLIPFSRDKQNHEQIIDVLDNFACSLPQGNLLPSAKRLEMEALI